MQDLAYSGKSATLPRQLMHWLITSLYHQQTWCWLHDFYVPVFLENEFQLDRTRRKASEICLRYPSPSTPTRSPDNAKKPQIWLVSVKGAPWWKNPQSTTKMPGNPFHQVKIVSKLEKSTNCDHYLISSEGGQDTSACKMSGHFLNGFSRNWPQTSNLTCFTASK